MPYLVSLIINSILKYYIKHQELSLNNLIKVCRKRLTEAEHKHVFKALSRFWVSDVRRPFSKIVSANCISWVRLDRCGYKLPNIHLPDEGCKHLTAYCLAGSTALHITADVSSKRSLLSPAETKLNKMGFNYCGDAANCGPVLFSGYQELLQRKRWDPK